MCLWTARIGNDKRAFGFDTVQRSARRHCKVVFLKRDVIVGDLHRLWECTVRQGQIGYDIEVQNVVSVHEHNLAALRRIEAKWGAFGWGAGVIDWKGAGTDFTKSFKKASR